jgi:predicted SnoaL-like aldol condensation-catalyzing enzyme
VIEDNKQLMLRMLAAFASGDASEGRAIVAPEYIDHQDEHVIGQDGFVELIAAVHLRYPDLTVSVDDLLAEDDRVVARVRWEGTRESGHERTTAESVDIVRFADGRAVEHWGISRGWP